MWEAEEGGGVGCVWPPEVEEKPQFILLGEWLAPGIADKDLIDLA